MKGGAESDCLAGGPVVRHAAAVEDDDDDDGSDDCLLLPAAHHRCPFTGLRVCFCFEEHTRQMPSPDVQMTQTEGVDAKQGSSDTAWGGTAGSRQVVAGEGDVEVYGGMSLAMRQMFRTERAEVLRTYENSVSSNANAHSKKYELICGKCHREMSNDALCASSAGIKGDGTGGDTTAGKGEEALANNSGVFCRQCKERTAAVLSEELQRGSCVPSNTIPANRNKHGIVATGEQMYLGHLWHVCRQWYENHEVSSDETQRRQHPCVSSDDRLNDTAVHSRPPERRLPAVSIPPVQIDGTVHTVSTNPSIRPPPPFSSVGAAPRRPPAGVRRVNNSTTPRGAAAAAAHIAPRRRGRPPKVPRPSEWQSGGGGIDTAVAAAVAVSSSGSPLSSPRGSHSSTIDLVDSSSLVTPAIDSECKNEARGRRRSHGGGGIAEVPNTSPLVPANNQLKNIASSPMSAASRLHRKRNSIEEVHDDDNKLCGGGGEEEDEEEESSSSSCSRGNTKMAGSPTTTTATSTAPQSIEQQYRRRQNKRRSTAAANESADTILDGGVIDSHHTADGKLKTNENSGEALPVYSLQDIDTSGIIANDTAGTAEQWCHIVKCKRPKDFRDLIICCDCGRGFHAGCCEPPLIYDFVVRFPWRCNADKVCSECQSAESEDAMLLCDCCDRCYHKWCASPAINEIPTSYWFCEYCGKCGECGNVLSVEEAHDLKCFDVGGGRCCTSCAGTSGKSFASEEKTCAECGAKIERGEATTCCNTCQKGVHIRCTWPSQGPQRNCQRCVKGGVVKRKARRASAQR